MTPKHLNEEQFTDALSGAVPREGAVREHLESCLVCRRELEELRCAICVAEDAMCDHGQLNERSSTPSADVADESPCVPVMQTAVPFCLVRISQGT